MKKNRGSLTVEAAIILPIVLISWLTIINFLNIYFIHICIQQALNNTAKRLAEYAYIMERTDVLPKVVSAYGLDKDTEEKAINIRDNVDTAIDRANTVHKNTVDLIDNAKQAGNNALAIKDNTNEVFNSMGSGDMNSLSKNLEGIKDSGEKLVNNFQHIELGKIKSGIIEPAKEFGNAVKNTYEVVKTINGENVKDYFISELTNGGTGLLVGLFVKSYITDLNIKQMENVSPLDFTSSKFFFGKDKNTFAITVVYTYNNPLGFKFFDKIQMHQTAIMNMWVGDEASDIRTLIQKK